MKRGTYGWTHQTTWKCPNFSTGNRSNLHQLPGVSKKGTLGFHFEISWLVRKNKTYFQTRGGRVSPIYTEFLEPQKCPRWASFWNFLRSFHFIFRVVESHKCSPLGSVLEFLNGVSIVFFVPNYGEYYIFGLTLKCDVNFFRQIITNPVNAMKKDQKIRLFGFFFVRFGIGSFSFLFFF